MFIIFFFKLILRNMGSIFVSIDRYNKIMFFKIKIMDLYCPTSVFRHQQCLLWEEGECRTETGQRSN